MCSLRIRLNRKTCLVLGLFCDTHSFYTNIFNWACKLGSLLFIFIWCCTFSIPLIIACVHHIWDTASPYLLVYVMLSSLVVFDFCSCLWLLHVCVFVSVLCEYLLFWNLSHLFYSLTVWCEYEESEGVCENVSSDVKRFTPLLMLIANVFVL